MAGLLGVGGGIIMVPALYFAFETLHFDLRKGDEVILTDQEHVGNALPWLNRQRLEGIVIRSFHPEDTAEKVLAQVKKLINPKTKVIAIPHIPCTTGQVYPIKEICEIARNAGVMTLIDGAHGAGMLNLNLKDLGCDIYSSCCHKWLLGPKGTGFMYVRKDLIENSSALFVGGHSDTGWTLNTEEQSIKGFQLLDALLAKRQGADIRLNHNFIDVL